MNWLLPEHLADALPEEALHIERLRRLLLDLFSQWGFELVMPPSLEYLESLLTGAGQELDLRTFKLIDQLSGRSLGLRADITPQVARIDAHLLNREGVTRLCYCGHVLHALPSNIASSREPIQIGAELYGYAGIEADLEMIRLLEAVFNASKLQVDRIDLGHAGIFRTLSSVFELAPDLERDILALLQSKDVPGLHQACIGLSKQARDALTLLPQLYGEKDVLERARTHLPKHNKIIEALDSLEHIVEALPDLPLSVDLADLRGYHYHNGIVFSAYIDSYAAALAQGGRYDGVGRAFGRERPATGFSLDLRELARLAPRVKHQGAILAPAGDEPQLVESIMQLRAKGEMVIVLLPEESAQFVSYERKLVFSAGKWQVEAI